MMTRHTLIYCIVSLLIFSCTPGKEQVENIYAPFLQQQYEKYKDETVSHRRFKHAHIYPIINNLASPFSTQQIGRSAEGRAIMMATYGNGPVDVLLWSQMHGDEPTATMALLDIFKFLSADDELNPLREIIKANLTLHFIPMLNPDGAEKYQRRNAQGIDINRDALRLQTREGRLLKQIRDSLKADWGFNLHDQGRNVSAGKNPASISFLAPAFDQERTLSANRLAAMQVIVQMNSAIDAIIPNAIGRYWDDFEPRAFGDNIQKWGTKTILIESGGHVKDREKQVLRKVNFVALLTAFHAIATENYASIPVSAYEDIPVNGREYHDVIVRNLKVTTDTLSYITDIAYKFTEVENETQDAFYLRAGISDIGDLSTSWAYREFDAAGYDVTFGKMHGEVLPDLTAVHDLPVEVLLQQGTTEVLVQKIDQIAMIENWSPFKIVGVNQKVITRLPQLNDNPSFVLSMLGEAKYAIINGRIIDLQKPLTEQAVDLTSY